MAVRTHAQQRVGIQPPNQAWSNCYTDVGLQQSNATTVKGMVMSKPTALLYV